MDGILINKLKNWFERAQAQIKHNGITQDIHIDEVIVREYNSLSKAEVLNWSYQIFYRLVDYIDKVGLDPTLSIYLNIELDSGNNNLTGQPKSLFEIEQSIEMNSIPEIILYHDFSPNEIPLIELYRTPLFFDEFPKLDNLCIFYKEYRTIDEQMSYDNYSRELNIIFQNIKR